MPIISNPEYYANKIVEDFLAEVDGTFECRKRLWRTVVTLFELTGDASPYVNQLIDAMVRCGARTQDVTTTVQRAEQHYRRNADPRFLVA